MILSGIHLKRKCLVAYMKSTVPLQDFWWDSGAPRIHDFKKWIHPSFEILRGVFIPPQKHLRSDCHILRNNCIFAVSGVILFSPHTGACTHTCTQVNSECFWQVLPVWNVYFSLSFDHGLRLASIYTWHFHTKFCLIKMLISNRIYKVNKMCLVTFSLSTDTSWAMDRSQRIHGGGG